MIHRASKLINKIMKKNFFTKVFFSYFLLTSILVASQSDSFEKGIELFKKNKLEKSKIHFERDLVFNPKNEKSYLYLAKIFNENENDEEVEINLNNVLLLNPQNDEAIYLLALLKIKQSDYEEAKILIEQFSLVCKSFCPKKNEMEKKLNTLTPENEKSNN